MCPLSPRVLRRKLVGRGMAWGDFNNDGRPDLAVSQRRSPARQSDNQRSCLTGLELMGDGQESNRNAIGARIEVESNGGRQVRFINGAAVTGK